MGEGGGREEGGEEGEDLRASDELPKLGSLLAEDGLAINLDELVSWAELKERWRPGDREVSQCRGREREEEGMEGARKGGRKESGRMLGRREGAS